MLPTSPSDVHCPHLADLGRPHIDSATRPAPNPGVVLAGAGAVAGARRVWGGSSGRLGARVWALCLCLASAALAAPPGADEAAQQEYDRAVAAYRAGDLGAALDGLERAQALKPKPIYVYNIGRVLEDMGRLRAALEAYLKVAAMSRGTAEIRALSRRKAELLSPLVDQALLRFSRLPEGSAVQVRGDRVADLASDVAVAPGACLICVVAPDARRVSCSVVLVAAGFRLDWPPAAGVRGRVVLANDLGAELASVAVDGVMVHADWRGVSQLDLAVGAKAVTVGLSDHTELPAALDRAGQGVVPLSSVIARPGPEPPVAAPVEPPAVVETTSPGSGPWPWVLVGVGSAAIAAGVGLVTAANLTATADADATQAEAAETWAGAQQLEAAGWSVMGVGLATLAGGLGWYFMASEGAAPEGPAARLDLGLSPEGGWLGLSGSF